MNHYVMPLKREVWEHHGAFIKTPIIILAVIIVALAVASFLGHRSYHNASFQYERHNSASAEDSSVREFSYNDKVIGQHNAPVDEAGHDSLPIPEEEINKGASIINNVPYVAFGGLMLVITIGYLLSSLSADRKDNSILFWKSMPVSEAQNVLTKLFVAVVFLPAIAWLAALALSIILLAFALIVALLGSHDEAVSLVVQKQSIIGSSWRYVGTFIAASLWSLPIFTWLLLASAAAKRTPFLIAVIPLVSLVAFERLVFGSHVFIETVVGYVIGVVPGHGRPMIVMPDWAHLGHVMSSLQFWLGLTASVCMLYGAIWLRENRYES